MEADDGEALVCEDAVSEAVDAVPVGAAVPDLLGEADDVGAIPLHTAITAPDPEDGQDPAHCGDTLRTRNLTLRIRFRLLDPDLIRSKESCYLTSTRGIGQTE